VKSCEDSICFSVVNGNSVDTPLQNGHVDATPEKQTKDAEESEKKELDESKSKDEVVFIQDVGFSVKIVSPGAEPFDIQVSSMELVQEIHQLLMDREDSCHRTCFSLQLDGNTLDNFAELKNIEGLKEGSLIRVVEEPYTMREARIHVRHVRDLLKSLDPADAYNGTECSSLSFLNTVTQGDILEKKKMRPESVDCTPPDYIMPDSKDRPLTALQPQLKDQKVAQCVKVLTTSAWNPPPGYRKIHGDLMYLYVVTLEDKHYYISACSRGFYINQSTAEEFNPKSATPSHLCHSLIELLNQISPQFKRNFALLQKKRSQRHPFERVATPYQLYTWTAPMMDHTIDAIRAEDTFSSKLGYEEHIPGQTRDWNEELQTTRELPRKTLPERLLRERAIFKVHSDFVAAATRGAMAVIDGNVMAINPGEEAKMQMFIWNNIFFSLGFDVRDHYKELGGDAAAFVAPVGVSTLHSSLINCFCVFSETTCKVFAFTAP
jgi:protein TIF31